MVTAIWVAKAVVVGAVEQTKRAAQEAALSIRKPG